MIHRQKITRFALGITLLVLLGFQWVSLSEETAPPGVFSNVPHNPKIESTLEIMAQTQTSTTMTVPPTALMPRQASYFQPQDKTVRVIVEPEGKNANAISAEQLRAAGAVIEARSRSLLRVRVPLKNLRALAEKVDHIRFIRRPLPMVASKIKVSEGVVSTGAALFHSQGLKGQRVRVAVIDLGFTQLSRAKQIGELPPTVIVDETDYSGAGLEGGTPHGTAVAEIVHDMAPEAWIYLKRATDEVELEEAVDDAVAQGVSIINYSVGVANSNFDDGTGVVDEIVDRARAFGILWVNAAGNHAQAHWMGRFTDNDHNDWHEFLPNQEWLEIHVQSFFPIQAYLTWEEWPTSSDDFDLFLYDAAGNLVASSQNRQTGFEPPTEEIEYMPQGVGLYRLKIFARNVRRPGIRMNLFVFGEHQLSPYVPEGSLLAPADARGALAVGAIAARNWKAGPQEDFSSQGPTSDGRIKPDISGPDQVSNWALFNFSGTSAASPHVAGAAALLLSRNPELTADQLQRMLEAAAIDMGDPGKDPIYGAGRLELSFGPITAHRAIREVPTAAGRQFTVEISVQMPVGLFGAVELVERLPEGFTLTPVKNDGARFKQDTRCEHTECASAVEYHWLWALGSGENRKINYQLEANPSVAPGVYSLVGTLNGGETVQGEDKISVIALPVKRPIALKPKPSPIRAAAPIRLVVTQRKPAVRFQAQGSAPMSLQVSVYDLAGRLIFREERPTGALDFSGLDRTGRPLPNGVYFYVATLRDREGHIYQSRLERFVLVR